MRVDIETKTFDTISATVADPTADTDGESCPAWAQKAVLSMRVSTGTPTTVPTQWWGRQRGDKAWVKIPTAALANLYGRADDLWMIEVNISGFDRVFPQVDTPTGTAFTMSSSASFQGA